jgi:hypothetical protein
MTKMAQNYQEATSKILIVFDINGTILKKIKKDNHIRNDLITGTRCLRPFAEKLAEFLNKSNIDYAFWTTQKDKKAEKSINALLNHGFTNAKFIWKGGDCKKHNIKDLSLIVKKYPEYRGENILIVDDTDSKIINKERYIKVTTFQLKNLEIDEELLHLENYFATMIRNLNLNESSCTEYLSKNKYSHHVSS